MGPLVLVLFRGKDIPWPSAQVLFETFTPNYICAVMALAPAIVMHELGRQVSQAKREARGRWLLATAQAAADAAKDGGFMGFGAKQVSDGEQAMLDRVRDAVST